MCNCKSEIVPKRIERFPMRLFDEEIDIAKSLCFQYEISYEQLFVKLLKERPELETKIEELENELDQDPEPPYHWRDDRD